MRPAPSFTACLRMRFQHLAGCSPAPARRPCRCCSGGRAERWQLFVRFLIARVLFGMAKRPGQAATGRPLAARPATGGDDVVAGGSNEIVAKFLPPLPNRSAGAHGLQGDMARGVLSGIQHDKGKGGRDTVDLPATGGSAAETPGGGRGSSSEPCRGEPPALGRDFLPLLVSQVGAPAVDGSGVAAGVSGPTFARWLPAIRSGGSDVSRLGGDRVRGMTFDAQRGRSKSHHRHGNLPDADGMPGKWQHSTSTDGPVVSRFLPAIANRSSSICRMEGDHVRGMAAGIQDGRGEWPEVDGMAQNKQCGTTRVGLAAARTMSSKISEVGLPALGGDRQLATAREPILSCPVGSVSPPAVVQVLPMIRSLGASVSGLQDARAHRMAAGIQHGKDRRGKRNLGANGGVPRKRPRRQQKTTHEESAAAGGSHKKRKTTPADRLRHKDRSATSARPRSPPEAWRPNATDDLPALAQRYGADLLEVPTEWLDRQKAEGILQARPLRLPATGGRLRDPIPGEHIAFWEVYSGCGHATRAVLESASGDEQMAAGPPVDFKRAMWSGLPLWNVLLPSTRQYLWAIMVVLTPAWVHCAPPCTFWSSLSRRTNHRSRTEEEMLRLEALAHLVFSTQLCEHQMRCGRWFSIEQPPTATSWKLDLLRRLLASGSTQGSPAMAMLAAGNDGLEPEVMPAQRYVFDSCRWDHRDPGNGKLYRKRQCFVSNFNMSPLVLRCHCRERHQVVEGYVESGARRGTSRAKVAGEYPWAFCVEWAKLIHGCTALPASGGGVK